MKTDDGGDTFDLDTDGAGLRPVLIAGSVDVTLGGQDGYKVDIASANADRGITIGRDLSIDGAADVDIDTLDVSSEFVTGDVTIGGNLSISSKVGLDTRFATTAILDGGTGVDTVDNAGLVVFAVPVTVKEIEVAP